MSITNDSSSLDGQATSSRPVAPINSFTLRDLYVQACISGNSLAAELGRYLNIDETTFSKSSKENTPPDQYVDVPTVHEQPLAAILDVVISNDNASLECVRVPEPEGGVQEWWARMLSGSINNSQPNVRVQR